MIEVRELTKRYGDTLAVDRLSFTVRPGAVTGFLGPNGAGKSTTMRLLLGLDSATGGEATVDGRRYADLRHPMRRLGALLDANAVQGSRSALNHLRWLARSNRIEPARVTRVLERVGLAGVARKAVGTFSLGMRQRLGIAAALLGEPEVLVLDEPVNGLDPDGVRWIRELLRSFAAEGGTVLLSSHLMSEMELTADRLLIIGRGRLIADTSVRELADRFAEGVLVRSARPEELADVLRKAGGEVTAAADGALTVRGLGQRQIGDLSAANGIGIYESASRSASLEDAYLSLTAGTVQFGASETGTVNR
ncbi:export ABC transporter ATP-binding protein [Actinoplanes sp. ATCC 53533]|uniref:ABC transporter ATP-binding protein n=1 Tax=Actinoplanes sp. ATCC 53533 TaxID=1288362 RepID=UPI000F776030|nr:ABC transporter ATP-binding protein [Actinoplanes sp. ATCC 53533]RSM59784.1 export ABC transporter ATP-binding protein [Actinoplanes sp. ATCC 53533]